MEVGRAGINPGVHLDRAAAQLHSALPWTEALRTALDELRQLTQAEAASMAVPEPLTGGALYVASVGPGAAGVRGYRLPPSTGIAGWVLEHGEHDLTDWAARDPRHDPTLDRLTQSQTRSMLTVPVRAADLTLGAIQVLNPHGRPAFDATDVPMATELARFVAAALVARGCYRQLGLTAEAVRDLDLCRRLAAWCATSAACLAKGAQLAASREPFLVVGDAGSGRTEAALAFADHASDLPRLAISISTLLEIREQKPLLAGRLAPLAGGGTLVVTDLEALAAADAPLAAGFLNRLMHERELQVIGVTRDPAREPARPFEGRWLEMPAPHERLADVQVLVGGWFRQLRTPLRSPARGLTPEGFDWLLDAHWDDSLHHLRALVGAILVGAERRWLGPQDLAEWDRDTAGELSGIERGLDDPRPKVRAEALRRIEAAGAEALPPVALVLAEHLEEPHDWLRIRIIRLLGQAGDRRAVPPLVERLNTEPDPGIVRELLAALGRTRSRAAVEALVRHLRDDDPATRATVLFALGRIGGSQARRAVEELAEDSDPRVRCTAQGALFHIDADTPGSEQPVALRSWLVVLDGEVETERRELTDASVSLGRTQLNDWPLPDARVSKEHAVIERAGNEWAIRDLGSTNGTSVNGERVQERVLVDGDVIEIGSFALRFDEEAIEAAAPPTSTLQIDNLESTLFQTIVPGALTARSVGLTAPPPTPPRPRPAPVDSPAVVHLLEETGAPDAAARQWAARVLGEVHAGVPRLIELLRQDPDLEVRVEAARALGSAGDLQAVHPLVSELENRWVRFAAIEALGNLRAPEAVDALVTIVEDERNSRLRRAAIRALGQIGAARAIPALAQALASPTIAADAVGALVDMGGEAAVDALSAHLDPADPLCADCALGLGRMGATHAIAPLIELLAAADAELAARASQALGDLGPAAAGQLIESLHVPARRSAALAALARVKDASVAPALMAHARDNQDARGALRQLGRAALPALLEGLSKDPELAVRVLAGMPQVKSEVLIGLLGEHAQGGHAARLLVARGAAVAGPLARELGGDRELPRRLQTVQALADIGSTRALTAIWPLLDEPGALGEAALRAAAALADQAMAAEVAQRFTALPLPHRVAAVGLLVHAPAGEGALDAALNDPEVTVRVAALLASEALPADQTRERIVALLGSDSARVVRDLAARRAAAAGWLTPQTLAAAVSDSAKGTAARQSAATLLAALPGDEPVNRALELAGDGLPEPVTQALVEGLAARGTEVIAGLCRRADGAAKAGEGVFQTLLDQLAFAPEHLLAAIEATRGRADPLARGLSRHLQRHRGAAQEALERQLLGDLPEDQEALVLEALVRLTEGPGATPS